MSVLDDLRSGNVGRRHLTFVLEEAGKLAEDDDVDVIIPYLKDNDPVVREGAIYALSRHLHLERVVLEIRLLSEHDTHSIIREIASELLEDL